jgi:hypothetical protein
MKAQMRSDRWKAAHSLSTDLSATIALAHAPHVARKGTMNEEVQLALEEAEAQYREYLSVAQLASVSAEQLALMEAERSISYPLGFTLDECKVHALVG